MESSRIPFLEELVLFLKGIVTPRVDFEERVLIYPRSGFSCVPSMFSSSEV